MFVPNIDFCLENGAMVPGDVERLTKSLASQDRVMRLAVEFDVTTSEMAWFALDAGIAFMRARLGTPDAGMYFSPAPVADAGWDMMADNPGELAFYKDFCRRLCVLTGVLPRVLEHRTLSGAERQRARVAGAIAAAVEAMDRLALHYVPTHWPLDASATCGDPAGSDDPGVGCRVHERLSA